MTREEFEKIVQSEVLKAMNSIPEALKGVKDENDLDLAGLFVRMASETAEASIRGTLAVLERCGVLSFTP